MLLYQAYFANQAMENCCWLYAPALAQCSMPFQIDFDNQVDYFVDALKQQGHAGLTIAGWRTHGIMPGSNVLREMGLKKIGELNDYVVEGFGTPDLTETYWKLHDLLMAEGPFVLQYPSLGSGHVHQTAITGLIYGKESARDPEDVFLITPHTQCVKLTVLPVVDLVQHSVERNVPVEIFRVPNRFGKPLRPDIGTVYNSSGISKFHQESIVLARSPSLSNLFSFF